MKKILSLMLFICLSHFVNAQQPLTFPTKPSEDCGFSLGTRGTIQLIPDSSGRYKCSYLKIESCPEILDLSSTKELLSEKAAPGTIDFVFTIASQDETGNKKKKEYQAVLILKNGCEGIINYKAEIKLENKKDFEPTSVLFLAPNVLTTEMWPYFIEMIRLYRFELDPFGKKPKYPQ